MTSDPLVAVTEEPGSPFRIEDGRWSVHDVEAVALAQALECAPCWLLGTQSS